MTGLALAFALLFHPPCSESAQELEAAKAANAAGIAFDEPVDPARANADLVDPFGSASTPPARPPTGRGPHRLLDPFGEGEGSGARTPLPQPQPSPSPTLVDPFAGTQQSQPVDPATLLDPFDLGEPPERRAVDSAPPRPRPAQTLVLQDPFAG